MPQITIKAIPDNLDAVRAFVTAQMQAADCPAKSAGQVELAVEEIFVNIAHYAYHPEKGMVSVTCDVDNVSDLVTVTFADRGRPYNPLQKDDPDLTLGAEDREIGGLGILMVKKLMDTVEYTFRDGENRLTLRKKIKEQ